MMLAIDIFILGLTIFLVCYEKRKIKKNTEETEHESSSFIKILMLVYLLTIWTLNIFIYFDHKLKATGGLYIFQIITIFVITMVFYKRFWKKKAITNAMVIIYIILSFIFPVYQKNRTYHSNSYMIVEVIIPVMPENSDKDYCNCYGIRINKKRSDEEWERTDDDYTFTYEKNDLRVLH